MVNLEDKNNNKIVIILVMLFFLLFVSVSGYYLYYKKVDYGDKMRLKYLTEEQQRLEKQAKKEKEESENKQKEETKPEEEENLVTKDKNLNANNITNYDIANLDITINGVDCNLPFSMQSIVTYGYYFRDKTTNSGYTYSQLNETLQPNTYSSFIEAMSPSSQIINLLIKNTSKKEQMLLNCDVYGISASTSFYGTSEVEPTMILSNGLYLGMPDGEMLKIMGSYDKKFYVDDNKKIVRYQWYQSLDGSNINNILTCDTVNGYVQMLSIEIE